MLYRRDFTREKLNHSQTPLLCRILGGDRGRVEVYYWVRLLGVLVVVMRIELGASKAMGDFAWTLKRPSFCHGYHSSMHTLKVRHGFPAGSSCQLDIAECLSRYPPSRCVRGRARVGTNVRVKKGGGLPSIGQFRISLELRSHTFRG